MEAAKYNDLYRSRAGAAGLLNVSEATVSDWELGLRNPNPEDIVRMSEAYNAPELLNYYCSRQCPIGRLTVPQIVLEAPSQSAISLIYELKRSEDIVNDLLNVLADGKITDDEIPVIRDVLKRIEAISKYGNQLRLTCMKTGVVLDA